MKRADREAHVWFDTMRRPDADEHRAEFDAWRGNPENAAAYARAAAEFDFHQGLSRTRLDAGARAEVRSPFNRRWAFATILAAAIALGFAWMILGNREQPQIAELLANQGETTLADGTRVTLMDGASIRTSYSDSERRVVLTGGRARFEVAHDAARPFVVAARNTEIVALGTIFEVNLLNLRMPRIALVQGSVEVRATDSRKSLRLRPGETAEVPAEGPRLATDPIMGKHSMRIDVDRTPLSTVLDQANRANDMAIRLADPELGRLEITGSFDLRNPEALARQLAAALDLEVERGADGPILRAQANKMVLPIKNP